MRKDTKSSARSRTSMQHDFVKPSWKEGFYFVPDTNTNTNTNTNTKANCHSYSHSHSHSYEKYNDVEIAEEYQLVVPHHLLHSVIDAARFNMTVTIHAFAIFKNGNVNGDASRSRIHGHANANVMEIHTNGMIVHNSSSSNTDILPGASVCACLPLKELQSLECELEIEKQNHRDNKRREKKQKQRIRGRSTRGQLFNIEGTICSVSPILGVNSNDPFALVEIYDDHNNNDARHDTNSGSCSGSDSATLTASIVVQGSNALVCQPGMHPGSIIRFVNVKRRKWHVPQSFQCNDNGTGTCSHVDSVPRRLFHRAPSHVFVVSDAKSIIWGSGRRSGSGSGADANAEAGESISEGDESINTKNMGPISMPLPMTVSPLTSLQGRVTSVKYTSIKHQSTYMSVSSNRNPSMKVGGDEDAGSLKIIHYIIIIPVGDNDKNNDDDDDEKRIKMYLTYFPLSSVQYLGLRKGALVRVVNVHEINSHVLSGMRKASTFAFTSASTSASSFNVVKCFGACLRSTLSIVEPASEHYLRFKNNNLIDMMKYQRLNVDCASCVLKQIKQSYQELEWISLCRKQVCQRGESGGNLIVERTLRKLIAKVRKDAFPSPQPRDPYKEWFDHACEPTVEECEANELNSCPIEAYPDGRPKETFPFVIQLSLLRHVSFQHINATLKEYCSSLDKEGIQSNRAGIGSTFSVHIPASKLLKRVGANILGSDVYVGGIVRETNSDGQIICVGNNLCSLTFAASKKGCRIQSDKAKTDFVHEKNSFVLIKVRRAIVSCLYLGSYNTVGRDNNESQISVDLASTHGVEGKASIGPSRVVQMGNHLCAVSIQIQYNENDVISLSINKRRNPLVQRVSMSGRLSRQRWKILKEAQNYIGCEITASYPTNDNSTHSFPCHMPHSIEIKLQIPSNPGTYDNNHLLKLIPKRIQAMCSAWQYTAESSCSPLVSGGWNEFQSSDPHENGSTVVQIEFPRDFDHTKPLNIRRISFVFSDLTKSKERSQCFVGVGESNFDYFGGRKWYKGYIDNRLYRSIKSKEGSDRNFGEALLPPHFINGLPEMSINALNHTCLLEDGMELPEHFKRLYKIKNAHLSKVNFCRARAECSRCYNALIKIDRKRSFWNQPLPISTLKNMVHANARSTQVSATTRNTNLVCPNGCDLRHAYIKWEMSGILKDSTGTAKIYSERETTTIFLENESQIKMIEKGAWEIPNGISYQASVPLSPELKLELDRANTMRSKDVNPATKLSNRLRASYELHCICTNTRSNYLARRMDFVCQQKPTKREQPMVESVRIPLISAFGSGRGVMKSNDFSMTTCRLQLSLVDCYRSYDDPKDIGWSIINTLL